MSSSPNSKTKITSATFRAKKERGEPISMLTAYDFLTARAVDLAGIDSILVGDSLGMVILGYENTLPVTMEDMLHHCKAVARGASRALLIGDMPFMSYQISPSEALRNAGRFLQEAGMDAVKLEGGRKRLDAVRAIIGAGIPVLGHLGLTPQSVNQLGGFKTQGKLSEDAVEILDDALALEDAGCFGIVLESIPSRIAKYISNKVSIPTIGIGAGPGCDGQVLVTHDLLGLYDKFTPKFVKQYKVLHQDIHRALQGYKKDIEDGSFPGKEHSFSMSDMEWHKFIDLTGDA